MNNLHDWLFHFNAYTKKWEAVKREDHQKLFSNQTSDKILRSSSITTLIDLVRRTDGDKDKIDELLKHYV